jgi:NADH-quinone oxidoreductase subunit J
MGLMENIFQWIIGLLLVLSSLGVVLVRKPIHASLCFLLTLLMLAALYLQLDAPFIAVMQVIVYAGAILVIFVFVIILFQDAHEQINQFKNKSFLPLLVLAASTFFTALMSLGFYFFNSPSSNKILPEGHGTVQSIGKVLYIDYFFPFEAVILLFLIAAIGSLYIAKREA